MMLPILRNDDLLLRALCLEDALGDYPNWLNDPVVCAHNSHDEQHYTQAMAEAYIQAVMNSEHQHVFAIDWQEQHVGNIALQAIDKRHNSAEFAILIGATDIYGQGIATRASRLLLAYGFEQLLLHRIYCGTSMNNIAMQHLALKLGFTQEGQRKEAFYKDGRYVDILEYGVLRATYLQK